jgi:Acetyltransferase (GNAT) domain
MTEVFRETAGQKTNEFDEALWSWQYEQNPAGSMVVIAEDAGLICGYYHALLLPMFYCGRSATAAMVQDVGTRASHRMRGIFKRVGGYALERLQQRGAAFIYSFPNQRSLPSFIRNHAYEVVTKVTVYLFPLRLGPLFAGRLRLGYAGRTLGGMLDLPYRVLFTKISKLQSDDTVMLISEFGEDVNLLTREAANRHRVGVYRSSEYLNWRFMQKPGGEYTSWGLYREARLLAYTVTRTAEIFGCRCVLFMDFGCRSGEESSLERLISHRVLEEQSAGLALAVVFGLHRDLKAFSRLGFGKVPERFNPRTFNLVCKDLQEQTYPNIFVAANWMITLADWDVY